MARNRKRAKERRARKPQPVASARTDRDEGAPPAIEHATPDVELAEAQLAMGRPELVDEPVAENGPVEKLPEDEGVLLEVDPELIEPATDTGVPGISPGAPRVEEGVASGATVGDAALPSTRAVPGNRLINFIQGSWRELQRVQWPDRRQVIQATGVVIGFVIVAGAFLGVADFLAGKLMDFILK